MARVLIATTPAEGHINPLLAVARSLTGRGHEVVWYTGRAYVDKICRTGSRHEAMRAAYDFSGQNKEIAFPHHAGLRGLANFKAGMIDIFYAAAPRQFADLLGVLERFPADVIVSDDMCYGASLVSEHQGIPLAWVANSVYILPSRNTAPLGYGLPPTSTLTGALRNAALNLVTDRMALRDLPVAAAAARAEVGLPRLPGHAMDTMARHPHLYVLGTVESFEFPRSDLFPPTHFVGSLDESPSDAELPAWAPELDGGHPVVLVTQGTVANDLHRLLLPAIRALADLPVLVVVTTGGAVPDAQAWGHVPDNVRVEKYVPYRWLMPKISAMVTNGGFNGVTAALSQGVPLVVAGASEEKADVAARVAWTGTGISLGRRKPGQERIRTAVTSVLTDPRYRNAARCFQEKFSTHDGPREAADLIEAVLVTSNSPTRASRGEP
jgi:MGT family glycosyltransferase